MDGLKGGALEQEVRLARDSIEANPNSKGKKGGQRWDGVIPGLVFVNHCMFFV